MSHTSPSLSSLLCPFSPLFLSLSRSSVSLECLSLLLSVYRCLLSASLAGKIEVKGHRGSSTESVSLPFPRSLLRAVLRRDVGEYLLVELREMVQVCHNELTMCIIMVYRKFSGGPYLEKHFFASVQQL